MPYNPFFPVNYQPYQQQQYQQPQTRTVEAIPVDDENVVLSFPVAVGATVMMVAKDDRFVAFKTNGMNGESSISFYDRRPPAPEPVPFDASQYVRRDELEKIIASMRRKDEMYEPVRPVARITDEPSANASADKI